jgi:replication factor A1
MPMNSPLLVLQHFLAASFKSYVFKCRIKSESYQDESRLKVSCLSLTPVDYVAEGRFLLDEIARLRY